MKIVVTGAGGYIGGQIMMDLQNRGHSVTGIDSYLHLDHWFNRSKQSQFLTADFADDFILDFLESNKPDAIIHCAGTSLVGPSIANPRLYYENNVIKTLRLLDFIVDKIPSTRIIFSSSASVYGKPIDTALKEDYPTVPISPYGESKLMIEKILASYHTAYQLNYLAFRYFNVCGADSQSRHGQKPNATHIIARVLERIKNNQSFVCNGNDYDTPDGTCVRDYTHVEDISNAHELALSPKIPCGVYNLGTSTGNSNLEIINSAKKITGQEIPVTFNPRRPGDPAVLRADATKFKNVSGWKTKWQLDDMISHAWKWYHV